MGEIGSDYSASIPSRPGKMPNSLYEQVFFRAVTEVKGFSVRNRGIQLSGNELD